MKKALVSIVCLAVLSLGAIPADAQTRAGRISRLEQRTSRRAENQVNRDSRYCNQVYGDSQVSDDYYYDDDYYDDDRSVWDRSRDKITTVAGAGAGAAIGALLGGKKGAIIGAIAGGGAAALYTYKIRDKEPNY